MAPNIKKGSHVVTAVVSLTLVALGVGTIYLPFIADKEKLRGMHESGKHPMIGQREYEKAMQEIAARERAEGDMSQNDNVKKPSNSMWNRMNQSAKGN